MQRGNELTSGHAVTPQVPLFMSGGSSYTSTEVHVIAESAAAAILTGVAELDQTTGGLLPGSVWSIVGPRGSGVTTLALRFGRATAPMSVLDACAHLLYQALIHRIDRLRELAEFDHRLSESLMRSC